MSTPARRRFLLDACLGAALVLAGAGAGAGCNKQVDPAVTPGGDGGSGQGALVELAPIDHPSQMLARDTSLLVMGRSFSRAAEVFERDRLVKAFGPQYTSLRAVISGTLGHDLLDPAAWRDMGLDPEGPMGLAVSDLVTSRMIVFATVSDRAKLVGLVRRVASKAEVELVEEPYGSRASILRAKGEGGGAVVLRDQLVALVLDDGAASVDLAKRLVTMDPNVSLAAQVGYRKATGGLRAADVSVYLDLEGMVEHANMQAEAYAAEPQTNWMQEELERAQQAGEPAERLAELERRVREHEEREAKWRRRGEGTRALSRLMVSGIDAVAFSATAKRSGPVFDGRVVAGPEAFVRRLLANRDGAPVLPVAMSGAPLWCGFGRADSGAAFELLEAIAVAEGETVASFLAAAKGAIGLELRADLEPVLEGHAEVCVTLDGDLGAGRVNPKEQLGVGAIVRVKDAPQAKYVLAKMATSSSELGGRMRKRGDGYSVEVRDWRTMYLQPVGASIVISTDPELGKRLAVGDPGSMPSKIRPQSARGAMELPGTALTQVFDLSLGVLGMMMGRMDMGEMVVVAPGLTEEEMKKVPHSAKSKKARKTLDEARARVNALEAKQQALQSKEALSVTDAMGIMVGTFTEDDRGFVISGGLLLRAESLGAMVEGVLRGVLGTDRPSLDLAEQAAQQEGWERYMEAQQALSDARLEDAARYQSKRKR